MPTPPFPLSEEDEREPPLLGSPSFESPMRPQMPTAEAFVFVSTAAERCSAAPCKGSKGMN